MNDVQLNQMVQNQVEHIFELCKSYAEVGEEDNVRALYEEYGEWIETKQYEEYTIAYVPDMNECAS